MPNAQFLLRNEGNFNKENKTIFDKNSQKPKTYSIKVPLLVSLMAALFVIMLSAALWQQLRTDEDAVIQKDLQEEMLLYTQGISDNFYSALIALQRMAQRWEAARGTPEDQWQEDARHYVEDITPLRTVEWVDETYHVRWIVPLEGNEKAIGLNILFNETRKKALEDAAQQHKITITPPLDLVQGYRAFIAYVPIYIEDDFQGFIAGIFDISSFLQSSLPVIAGRKYGIMIKDEDKILYSSPVFKDAAQDYSFATELELFNRTWSISIRPTQALLAQQRSFLPTTVLLAGIFIAILLGFAIYAAISSYRKSRLLRVKTVQLQESEARINLILDNAGEGIYGLDTNGHTTFVNKAAVEILGYTLEEMINVSQHDLIHHTLPDGSQYHKHDCNIYAAFKDGKIHTEDKEVFWHKKGYSVPIEYTSAPLRDEKGEISGAVVVFKDITERKKAERELKQANAELEEFAYRTSHDLRSPLVSSISLLGVAHKSIAKDDDAKALKSIELAQNSLKNLELLVRDILALTETKNREEDNQLVDPAAVIEKALEKITNMDNFERLSIETDFSHVQALHTKPSRFKLIAENLISNAVKYQNQDEPKPFIKISTREDNGNFIFAVEDNGLGIPKDKQGQLFSMFKRFHENKSYGSGLGLYMIKKSAEIIGGDIIYKDTGKGSIFQLVLPKEQ